MPPHSPREASCPVPASQCARRVLLLTAGLENGGLERQLALLARNLPPRWSPLVWSFDDGPFRAVLEGSRIPVVLRLRRTRRDPRPLFDLMGFIVNQKPDVVHAWHWLPAAAAAPVSAMLGVPFIDGTIRLGLRQPEFGRPRDFAKRFADRVVANSFAGLRAWGIDPGRGRVVYNAFDAERLTSLGVWLDRKARTSDVAGQERPFTVVMTGRMHPRKDYRALISAARRLSTGVQPEGWRFLLVGGGPERASLEREARDLLRSGVVGFDDAGLEVLPVVEAADVGVLMTNSVLHAEGCSNSIMEYMACGLPVVCSDSGGNREIVRNGVDGYLVEPGDVGALCRCLLKLRRSPELRVAMGASGRERMLQDFSVRHMVDAYVTQYEECIADARRGPAGGTE